MGITIRASLLATATALSALVFASSGRAACTDLAALKLPNTVIESAAPVAAGAFTVAMGGQTVKVADLPAFCRVIASVKAVPDSDIHVEIWLPENGWKGVFHGNGNGGFAGSLALGYAGMEEGLKRGYATATTDMGTAPATVLNGDPLIGHPQKWKDWGLLSTHVMTVTGKAIVKAFYGKDAGRSYFTGCSTGGQQGLIEAQYFPDDYDGILAGAPVINRTWGHALVLWDWLSANLKPGRKLSDAKLALLHRAALRACGDKGNGLASDPFVGDPLACKFDPATLACHGADNGECLTQGEVRTARDFYSGPRDHAGKITYYGWLPGSEMPGQAGWSFLESPPHNEPAFDGLFKWVFGAGWDWRRFDFDRDMPKVDATLGPSLNGAVTGDLGRFKARGGKLILYQGWADTLVPPGQTIAFYHGLDKKFGKSARDFVRLFMAPGMMHCGGGTGPTAFNSANGGAPRPPSGAAGYDLFTAMTRWVETGAGPMRVVATKYIGDTPARGIAMQRPLCAYPEKVWFKGSGRTAAAANFICAVKTTSRN